MPLEKATIPVSLGIGVDTRTDPKQLQGKLTVLQNGVITGKRIVKRNGNQAFSQNKLGGGTISAGVGVQGYIQELLMLDGSKLYSYSQGATSWSQKGTLTAAQVSTTAITRNLYQQSAPDSAVNGNYQLFVWNDTRNSGSVRYTVIDTATGQQVVADQVLSTLNADPIVRSLGSYFVIFYQDVAATAIRYKYVSIATPQTLSSQQTLCTDFDTTTNFTISGRFDVCVTNGIAYIGYPQKTGATQAVAVCSLTSSFVTAFNYAVGEVAQCALTVFSDGSNNVWVCYCTSTTLRAFILSSALATVLAPTTVDASPFAFFPSASNVLTNITGVVRGNTASIYYDGGFAANYDITWDWTIVANTLTLSGTAGTATKFTNTLGLASKAFVYNSKVYLLGTFSTLLQATYFLIDETGSVVAKFSTSVGGGTTFNTHLPQANLLSGTTYQIATLQRDALISFGKITGSSPSNSGTYTTTGLQSSQVTFSQTAQPKLNIGQCAHFGGGIVTQYDGSNIVEQNFHLYPEGILATTATSGGAIGISYNPSTSGPNTIQYVAVYEWMDNQGQLHRSGTSLPLTVYLPTISSVNYAGCSTVAGSKTIGVPSPAGLAVGQIITSSTTNNFPSGTYITAVDSFLHTIKVSVPAGATVAASETITTKDLGKITVVVPTLRLSSKQNVSIVLYRTTCNGTLFYRVSNPANPTYNDPTVQSLNIDDVIGDSTLIGNEQLYTTGGEVTNGSPPSVSAVCAYKNRFIYISPENPYQFGYSKQVIPGSPVEFSPLLFNQNVDPTGGVLTCSHQMDDKLILFKRDLIMYTAGDGPSPAGTNNDFLEPQVIPSDTGCNNAQSIVLTPIGLMFQSPKGIYLLDRSLGSSYIGADVEAYNAQTVTSAQLIPSTQQVRFTLSNGTALVFDYLVNQWSVFTNHSAVDSTIYNNSFTFVSSAGLVMQEAASVFTDNGSFIQLSLTTSWLNLSGLEALQRIWHFEVLGDYKSAHTLQVNLAYDYSSSFSQNVSIPVLSQPATPYQFRIHIQNQKCEAVQVQIQDSQSSNFGEGMSLSGMTFYAGLKKGLEKLPAAQSYG